MSDNKDIQLIIRFPAYISISCIFNITNILFENELSNYILINKCTNSDYRHTETHPKTNQQKHDFQTHESLKCVNPPKLHIKKFDSKILFLLLSYG